MRGRVCVWMDGGVHGSRVCIQGGVHGGGHAWQGVCGWGDMHGRGPCVAGGRACMQERRPLKQAVRILLE